MKKISTSVRRGLALITLLTAGSLAAQAQSVGIGTTAPDVSAALDIVSSSKGVLLPRVASTSGVPTPATGLIVYQTGGTPGYYYNSGTSGAPVWQQFATATGAAVTASNGLTKTGSNIALGGTLTGATTIAQAGNSFSLTGGNVGVGTATPTSKLTVNLANDAEQGLRVSDGTNVSNIVIQPLTGSDAGFQAINYNGYFNGGEFRYNTSKNRWRVGTDQRGNTDRFFIDTFGASSGNSSLNILTNGYVGLSTLSPLTLLDLGSSFGVNPSDQSAKKLAVYNDNTFSFYGLGVSTGQLNFFAGAGPTGAPGMALNANGSVGIGSVAPTSKLTVNLTNDAEQGLRVSDGTGASNIVIQPLVGGQAGFQAINYNGYYNGAEFLYNPSKNRWRVGVDQRAGSDRFFIDTYNGTVGSTPLTLLTNGNVGIGNLAPAYKLEVAGDINAIGQVRANGVVLTSDARFKQQVRPLGGALAAVQALRGVRYTWNALGIQHGGQAGAEQVGVLAQELEKVLPELVSTGPDGYKAVNYAQLTPVLIEAIKEQQQQIEALKAQNAALQGRTAQAEADHASLQTLQAQVARLLGETAPAGAQARK